MKRNEKNWPPLHVSRVSSMPRVSGYSGIGNHSQQPEVSIFCPSKGFHAMLKMMFIADFPISTTVHSRPRAFPCSTGCLPRMPTSSYRTSSFHFSFLFLFSLYYIASTILAVNKPLNKSLERSLSGLFLCTSYHFRVPTQLSFPSVAQILQVLLNSFHDGLLVDCFHRVQSFISDHKNLLHV